MRATERQRTTETPPTLRRPRSPGALHRLQSVTGTISNDSVESTGTHWRAGPRSRRVAFSEAAPAGVGRSTVDCSGVTLRTVVLCLFSVNFLGHQYVKPTNICTTRSPKDRQRTSAHALCLVDAPHAAAPAARTAGSVRHVAAGGAGRADTCDSHMSHDDMNLSYTTGI